MANYYNKQQVDQQIQNNKPDLSNYYDSKTIDSKLSWLMTTSPQQQTLIDINYYISVPQVRGFNDFVQSFLVGNNYINKDNIGNYLPAQANYLLVTPTAQIALNANYTIQSSQITDFNTQIANYLLVSPQQKILLNSKYSIQLFQIQDLNNLLIQSNQIGDLQVVLQNYVLQSSLNAQFQSQSYLISNCVQQSVFNSTIKNYLKIIPDSPTVLNQNYSINSYQIIDMVTNYYTQQQINSMFGMLSNYLLVRPTTQIQLNNNYTIKSTQISNLNNVLDNYVLQLNFLQTLNNYMQINPKNNTAINSYYTINSSQITDLSNTFSNYLLSSPQSTTALNTNYTIICAQVVDIANSYCSLNYVDQQLANYVSITYFSQNLAFYPTISYANSNYMIISPTKSTAINNNYTMASTQITDFNSAVTSLIYGITKNYLLTNPLYYVTLNANYQIQTSNIPSQTINTSQIQNNTIQISNLDSTLAPIFYSLYSCSQQEAAATTNQGQTKSYQTNTPLGFYHYNKIYYNGTLMSNNQIYIGGSYYQFKTTNSMSLTGASSYINFDTSKQIYGADKGNQGAVGMFSVLGPFNSFIGSTALGVNLTGNSSYSYPITFSVNNANNSMISYINTTGAYTVNSDENLKHNLTKKQNFQDQLEKLLNLKIVTYSYGQKYQQDIDDYKKQIQDSTISNEEKQIIQQKIEDLQTIQAKCILGFTYQDLDKNGFKYALSDQQIMDDNYLDNYGIDKEKVKQKIKSCQSKTVQETALIPYVIMGIKALNEKIEQQSQRLDIIDLAMMKTHEIINEVSSQADQKIQDVQNTQLLNSINSDNIDDIKNTLNKLIYSFDNQQQTIKKLQNSINFLVSQNDQQQQTIEKQQQDIINLKLKAKIV